MTLLANPPSLHHLAVVVADLARAERFYVGVLGLPVDRRWDDDAGVHRSTWVRLGDAFLALERASPPSRTTDTRTAEPRRSDGAPGFHCVALRIERSAREQVRARLEAHGHRVERESAYTLYVRDPDGNLVGFSHWPDPIG